MRPAASLLLGIRERRGKEDPARRRERMGIAGKPRPSGPLAWIHAASVGELNAVLPLADALREAQPGLVCLFTTGTVTSARIAERRLHPGDIHQYVPLDSPKFVARFLQHWQPDAAFLTESEIWPNMILQCAARSVPLALVNARMSMRSAERWKRLPGIARPLFSRFDLVLAQNEEMAQRFRDVGAAHVLAVGNLKIDAPPPPVDPAALGVLRASLAGRPFFVAASTHDGEEIAVAAAHRIVARHHPGLCTIIAPRHPERGIGIAETMKAMGLSTALRSLGELPTAATDVYIADTIGELGTLYALSSIAFVGGSLIAHGGQNPIEAVRCGAVVLTGPHWSNFTEAYETLNAWDAVIKVTDSETLAAAVNGLLSDPLELARLQSAAESALAKLTGALARSVTELVKLMPAVKELARAVE
jgi:3-deoxy-D-manno-octulosonic-acid transferase